MGAKTGIAWCDSTWSPVVGCSPISEGCKHCWASAIVTRFPNLNGGKPFSDIRFYPERLAQPSKWKKPRRIFVGGMTDLFHWAVDPLDRLAIWTTMDALAHHQYLVLTKRPSGIRRWFDYISWHFAKWPLPNVWLGVTIENQQRANERIPILLDTPAAIRWLSVEPLLGSLTLSRATMLSQLDLVIIGCESGPGRRPMKLEWAEALVEECRQAGIACFVKQIEINGKVVHDIERFPESLQVREWPR